MGYTHYWYTAKNINEKNWNDLMTACESLFKDSHKEIQQEHDCDEEPEVSFQRIRFNGIEDDGHETFMLESKGEVSEWTRAETKNSDTPCFGFCKTARKPYDIYVTATLILAKLYLKDEIRLSSDGEASDWQAGLDLINSKSIFADGWKLEMECETDDIKDAKFVSVNTKENV